MFGSIGYQEILVIGVVAILLFGKRLPEVARSWGNSYRDLRRSLNEMKTSFTMDQPDSAKKPKRASIEYDDRVQDSSPRFVPPEAEAETSDSQPSATESAVASEESTSRPVGT